MDLKTSEPPADVLLRRYFLGGTATEEDEKRLLSNLFAGVDGLKWLVQGIEWLEVAEDDLLECYTRGELPEAERKRVLDRLAASPAGRARLALTLELEKLANAQFELRAPLCAPSRLTLKQFEILLANLAPDREQAGTRYEDIRRRLVALFAWCESSEDVADEAINRVARHLVQGRKLRAKNHFAYFWGVARHVAQEMLRKRAHERQAAIEAAAIAVIGQEPESKPDSCHACLCACLARLSGDQRRLILEYHHGDHHRARHRERMAHNLGIGLNALRIRACRIRRQLETCCARCMAENEKTVGGEQ